MTPSQPRALLAQLALSVVVLAVFVAWVRLDPASVHTWAVEDGPIETLSALFFGISSVGFAVAAARSSFLRRKRQGPRYFMVIGWAVLMFVFMGEEVSWGQRMFGFGTPEALKAVNHQHEFNIHNIELVDSFMGGKYRYLSIMMLTVGLLLPLVALTGWGRRTIQWWGFPVVPIGYGLLFAGSYLYGKIFLDVTLHSNDATEVREFLFSAGMLAFGLHGALRPDDLFRFRGAGPATGALAAVAAGGDRDDAALPSRR